MGTVHTLPPRPVTPEDVDMGPRPNGREIDGPGPSCTASSGENQVARARTRADLILKLDDAIEKLQVDDTSESERRAAACVMLHAIMPLLGRAIEVLKPHRFVVSLLSAIVNELVEVDSRNASGESGEVPR